VVSGGIGIYPGDEHPLPPLAPIAEQMSYPWIDRTYDIGYNILPSFTGKGAMKASVKTLIEDYVVPIMKLKQLGAVSSQLDSLPSPLKIWMRELG